MTAQQSGNAGAFALIGDEIDIDALDGADDGKCDVRTAAQTRTAHIDLAGISLGIRHKIFKGLIRGIRTYDDDGR